MYSCFHTREIWSSTNLKVSFDDIHRIRVADLSMTVESLRAFLQRLEFSLVNFQ